MGQTTGIDRARHMFASNEIILLDGALGTQLERLGYIRVARKPGSSQTVTLCRDRRGELSMWGSPEPKVLDE